MITVRRNSQDLVTFTDYPALVIWGAGPDINMTKQEWRLKDRLLSACRDGIYSEQELMDMLTNHYDYEVIIS